MGVLFRSAFTPLVFLIGLMQILTGAPTGWLVTIVGAVMWLQFVPIIWRMFSEKNREARLEGFREAQKKR